MATKRWMTNSFGARCVLVTKTSQLMVIKSKCLCFNHVLETATQKKTLSFLFSPGFLGVRVFVKAPKTLVLWREPNPFFCRGKWGWNMVMFFHLMNFSMVLVGSSKELKWQAMEFEIMDVCCGCQLQKRNIAPRFGAVEGTFSIFVGKGMKEPNPTEKQKKDVPHWKSCFNMKTIPVHRSW